MDNDFYRNNCTNGKPEVKGQQFMPGDQDNQQGTSGPGMRGRGMEQRRTAPPFSSVAPQQPTPPPFSSVAPQQPTPPPFSSVAPQQPTLPPPPAPGPRGPEMRRPERREPERREPEMRRPEMREPEMRRPEMREPEMRRPEMRGPEMRGPGMEFPGRGPGMEFPGRGPGMEFPGRGPMPPVTFPGAPGMGEQPRTAPPNFIPVEPGMERRGAPEPMRVRFRGRMREFPRFFRGCLNRFTFFWMVNGNSFWFFPTFFDGRFVFGFRWRRDHWEYDRININRVLFFSCF